MFDIFPARSVTKTIAGYRTVSLFLMTLLFLSCSHGGMDEIAFERGQKFYYDHENYLNYRIVGDGSKTIIFLHGFGASGQTWDDILPFLDKLDATCIVFDLIGWGFSSKPEQGDYSMTANAAAITRFVVEQEVNDFILAGHSFGGGVALMSALNLLQDHEQQQPAALVLAAPAAYKTKFPFFVQVLRIPVLGSLLLAVTPADFQARYTLERVYFRQEKVTDERVARYSFFMNMDEYDRTLKQTAKQVIPRNFEKYIERYQSLDLPVLIVWGDQDPVLPPENGRRLENELPQATLAVVKDCGHNVQEECPIETAEAMIAFLTSIAPFK